MKMYKDGTIEGTPEEIAVYQRLQTTQQWKDIYGPYITATPEWMKYKPVTTGVDYHSAVYPGDITPSVRMG